MNSQSLIIDALGGLEVVKVASSDRRPSMAQIRWEREMGRDGIVSVLTRAGGLWMLNAEITVLRATISDLELARQAVAEVYLATSQHPTRVDDTALQEFLADSRKYLMMATREGNVLGTLYGYALSHPHRPEPQFFLYGIDVRPEHRNRGIGTALIRRFVEEARQAKAFEVWVLTNERNHSAMAMYAHVGFQRCGRGEVMLEIAL